MTATLERLSRMLVVIGILALVLIAGVVLVGSLSGSSRAVADVSSDLSPADGPEFYVAQAQPGSAPAVADVSSSPLFSDSGVHARVARSVADVSRSPQFHDSGVWADVAACTTWSEALAWFHEAKPVEDPVNGALSLAQAEFYVAKHGAAGAVC